MNINVTQHCNNHDPLKSASTGECPENKTPPAPITEVIGETPTPEAQSQDESISDIFDDNVVAERETIELPPQSRLAPESEGLGPQVNQLMVIGYDSDINGPDGVLVDFRPTRAELKTLAYHYLDRYYHVHEWFAQTGQSGSWEWREIMFTWRRFESIATALSPISQIKEFEDYIEKREAELSKLRAEVEAEVHDDGSEEQE